MSDGLWLGVGIVVAAGVAMGAATGVAGAALAVGALLPPDPAEPHATVATSIDARSTIAGRIVRTS